MTGLTAGCEALRKGIQLHAFSAVDKGAVILPLTPDKGIHIMPPVNTTRFTRWGYSSAGRALAWHARGQR
ncbi:hypothetical protein, partial [Kosakonia cowanii]|uniref:hypothetical protein n=1 Tax=Kosakonia cowanii TaxID=208223 RepID=UPI00289F2FB9